MSEPKTAEVKVVPCGWRTMESAPKDRTPVRALIHADLYPRVKPGRDDLVRWNGQEIVVHHPGIADDGFDTGWSLSAPVGHGGFPDEWFVGWLPTGLAASPPAETGEGLDEGDPELPDTPLARIIYKHFCDVHGLHPDEAADSTGELLDALSAQPVSPSECETTARDHMAWMRNFVPCVYDVTEERLNEIDAFLAHPASDQSDTERMRKARTEVELVGSIARAAQQDFDSFEAAWPPSKRGSRAQKALDSLKGRISTMEECVNDARAALAEKAADQ